VAPQQPASGPEAQPEDQVVIPAGRTPLSEVERNPSGRLVRVTAPTPPGVLVAYCDAAAICIPHTLEVAMTVPRQPGVRVGTYRDSSEGSATRGIFIFRQRSTGRWVAGDGQVLPVFGSEKLSLGAPRIPVD
jgi:hypothetical protein